MSNAAPSLRQLTFPSLLLVLGTAAAWFGIVVVVRHMGPMPGTMGVGLGTFVAVWTLMMTAMMLPSITPFASLYARTFTEGRGRRLAGLVTGYLLVWALAAVPAFCLAWLADRAIGARPAMATVLAVTIFAGCGIYQLTPVKNRCLARCRSPLGFVLKFGSYQGRTRDLKVGIYHGGFCLACCWALMGLFIAFGLMNLAAMIVLGAIVLAEKTGPWGRRFSAVVGVAAFVLAILVVFQPQLAPGLESASPLAKMGRMP